MVYRVYQARRLCDWNNTSSVSLEIEEGAVGQEKARQYVESSDCLIILGATLSDITLGMFTAKIDQSRIIYVSAEKLSVM